MVITIKQSRKIGEDDRDRPNVRNTEVTPFCEEKECEVFRIKMVTDT